MGPPFKRRWLSRAPSTSPWNKQQCGVSGAKRHVQNLNKWRERNANVDRYGSFWYEAQDWGFASLDKGERFGRMVWVDCVVEDESDGLVKTFRDQAEFGGFVIRVHCTNKRVFSWMLIGSLRNWDFSRSKSTSISGGIFVSYKWGMVNQMARKKEEDLR